DERTDPDEVRFAEHALEDASPLEQRDVDEGRVVEPEQVGRDVADVVIDAEIPGGQGVLAQLERVDRAILPESDEGAHRRSFVRPGADETGRPGRLAGQKTIEDEAARLEDL